MAGTSWPPPPPPLPQMAAGWIVRPEFCAPYPIDLVIVKKLLSLSDSNFVVTDVNGNIVFKVKGKLFSLRERHILRDAADNPILSFQQKEMKFQVGSADPTYWAQTGFVLTMRMLTVHSRWKVFRGESSDEKDLLFTVKKSSLIQFKTKLDVFLASNKSENVCDFKIEGSWFERSCTIYAGDSTNIVAQMHKKHTVQSIVLGKDTYGVTVYPNVDYAFIVALIVILEQINREDDGGD